MARGTFYSRHYTTWGGYEIPNSLFHDSDSPFWQREAQQIERTLIRCLTETGFMEFVRTLGNQGDMSALTWRQIYTAYVQRYQQYQAELHTTIISKQQVTQ